MQAARTVLRQQRRRGQLTIVLTGDDALRQLNQRHRQIDAFTDVLSFPAADMPLAPDCDLYLGDIVIAYPYARATANRRGTDLGDALSLLVVHGALHLLGYDHQSTEQRGLMWAAQDAALRELCIDPAIAARYGGD